MTGPLFLKLQESGSGVSSSPGVTENPCISFNFLFVYLVMTRPLAHGMNNEQPVTDKEQHFWLRWPLYARAASKYLIPSEWDNTLLLPVERRNDA